MRDYEELVERLRAHNGWALNETLDEAADAIEDLIVALTASNEVIAKSKPKWISVKERQPEKSGLYLTYHAKRGSMTMHYSANNEAWNAFDHEDEPKYALEVTHWMPISEPPKENGNG